MANAKLISFVDHQIEIATEPAIQVVNALLEEVIVLRSIVDKLKQDVEQLKQGGDTPQPSA